MMKNLRVFLFIFSLCSAIIANSQISVTATAGDMGPTAYTTISAAFTAINAGTHQGDILISVTGNTTEAATPTALLKSSSPSSYSSVIIRPSGGNWIINSAAAPTASRGIIELNGADNVTIDGDDPGTAGTRNLTIQSVTATTTGIACVRLSSNSTTGTDGADNNTVKNCIIIGSRSSATSTTVNYGIVLSNSTSITTGAYSSINTKVENNVITRCWHGIYANGESATYPNTGIQILKNIIGTPENGVFDDATTVGFRGIYIDYSAIAGTGALIQGNDIRVGVSTTGYSNTIAGIEVQTANFGITIDRNNIHDINQPSTAGWGAHGIYVTGSANNTSSTITNNFIRDCKMVVYQTSATSTFIPCGLFFTAGATNVNFINNTVVMNTQLGSGTNFSSFCVNSSVSGVNFSKFNNNILVNNATSTSAYCFYVSNTASISSANVNNNNYYSSGGNIGYYNGSARTTLANWQSATSKDNLSYNANPIFVSSTDLHLGYGITPSELESSGATVAITNVSNDFDNDARPGPAGSVNGGASKPDIGADEFDGVILDNTGPSISYTKLGFTCETNDRILANVEIVDLTGVPTSGTLVPRIYYAKKPAGGSLGSWSSQPGVLSAGTGQSGFWSFNIFVADMGGLILTDSVFYYVISQDLVTPSPNISSNPTGVIATNVNSITTPPPTVNKYSVNQTFTGVFNVGTGGDFATITEAINAYNTRCLTGPVTFLLTDATYNEASGMTVLANEFSSATNTLTIKPAPGIDASINTGTGNTVLRFAGTDYVTIDGSNNGTTSRNLTINYTGTVTGTVPVWIGSLGINQGVTNFTIKNCIVQNGSKGTGTSTTTTFGVFVGMANGGANGLDNDNVTIQNNHIRRCSYGIQAIGDGAGVMNNLQVLDNFIGDTLSDANSIARYGIFLGTADAALIKNNVIANVTHTDGANAWGINISTAVLNSEISGNKIYDINPVTTSGYGGKGIDINTANTSSNLLIKNNFISNIKGDGWSSLTLDAIVGIRIGASTACGGIKLYNNTINLGSGTFVGNASGSISAALYFGSTSTNMEVVNNILVTNLDNTTITTDKTYAIYSAAANTAFTAINYNDYFVSAPAGVLGFLTSDRVDLAAIQAGFGSNLNSQNIQPIFNSAKDLHLGSVSNLPFDNLGTMLAQVTTDIDGETRNAATPDIGADEFTFAGCGGQPMAGSISPMNSSKCVGNTQVITATGLSTGIGISYQWKIGPSGGPYVNVSGGSGATTASYTTSALTAGTYYYVLETTCMNSGQSNISNEFTLTVNPLPSLNLSPSGTTETCGNGSQLYTTTTDPGTTYIWKKNGTAISGETSSSYTATTTGTYEIVVTSSATGCKDSTKASFQILNKPVINATATPALVCTGANSQLSSGSDTLIADYTFLGSSGTYTPISGTSVTFSTQDDDGVFNLPIGFTFNHRGKNYTTFGVSTNGYVQLGATSTPSVISNALATNVDIIAALWDDNNMTGGSVQYITTGSMPNRVLTVQWTGMHVGSSGSASNPTIDCQIILYEGSNNINIVFGSTSSALVSTTASIGVSGGAGDYLSIYPQNPSSLSTVSSTAENNTISSALNFPSGTTYALNAANLTYNWSPATFLSSTNVPNPMANGVSATTTYIVTITNSTSGCSKLDTVTITTEPLSIQATATAMNICAGGGSTLNVTLNGGGAPFTFIWNDGSMNIGTSQSVMVTPSSSTTYTVTVSDACGTTSSSSVVITVNPNPTATLTPSGTSNICQGQTQVYTATTDIGDSYIWKRNGNMISGANTSSYGATLAGDYMVVVSVSATGCKDSSSIATLKVNPNPSTINISPSSSDGCSNTIVPLVASGGALDVNNTIGTGTSSNTFSTPYKGFYGGNKVQFLYTASELTAAGLFTSSQITSVGMSISAFTSPYTFNGFTIAMKNTSSSTLTTTLESGTTTVLNPTNYTLSGTAPFNVTHILNTPFTWDGTSNLIVEYCFNNNNGGGVSSNSANVNSHTAAGNFTSYYSADNTPDVCGTPGTATVSTTRPNITFNYNIPVTKSWSPTSGLFTDIAGTIAYMGENLSAVYANPTTSTTYTVTATSASGCTNTASVNVGITGDEVMNENNDGTGSLRKAIECTAAGDTVFVSSGSVNLINLLTQLNIDKPLLILDDNGSPVMLKFDFSSGALMSETNGGFKVGTMGNVTLDNIHVKHVANDATHPVIKNEGILTLKNSKVTGETGNTVPPVVQNATGATINAEGSSEIKNE